MYSRTNRAALIAQIGAINRPKITEGKSLDLGGAVKAYMQGREMAERRAKEQEQKNRVDAWINQLNGDETLSDTEKAYFTANPDAYGQRMANNLDFERQKELLGIKNQYDVDAAEKTAALAREIAQIKAGGNGLVNINMGANGENGLDTAQMGLDVLKGVGDDNRVGAWTRLRRDLKLTTDQEEKDLGAITSAIGAIAPQAIAKLKAAGVSGVNTLGEFMTYVGLPEKPISTEIVGALPQIAAILGKPNPYGQTVDNAQQTQVDYKSKYGLE